MTAPVSEDTLRITVVCTANRFRSVVVAATLRASLAGLPVEVDSLAANGPSGQPAIPEVVAGLAATGIEVGGHLSRRCEAGLLTAADLVVGFEGHHAAAAITAGGAPRSRTFLILELLDLLPPVRETSLRSTTQVRDLLNAVDRQRLGDFFDPRHQYADPMAASRRRRPAAVAELHGMAVMLGARLMGVSDAVVLSAPRGGGRRQG